MINIVKSAWKWLLTFVLKPLVLYRSREHVEFKFNWFSTFLVLQSAACISLVLWLYYRISPELFAVQFNSPWYQYVICFVVAHAFMGLFEYFFHRYTLHGLFWKFLWFLHRKHEEHHGLTHVTDLKGSTEVASRSKVRNKYAIKDGDQIQSSAFPAYALVTFWGIFSLVLVPLQLLLRSQPIVITGYMSVVFSFGLYEIIHAIWHLDYDKHWKKRVETSKTWRTIYGFHLMHHVRGCSRTNLAISGVFGYWLWDKLFGSLYIPSELPLEGVEIDPDTLKPPKPPRWLQWLDEKVDARAARIKKQEAKRRLAVHQSSSRP